MKELVALQEEMAITTSLKVAEVFEKQHKNVLRDIQQLIEDIKDEENGGQLKFEPSSYTNQQNKKMPMFLMNKDGFTL